MIAAALLLGWVLAADGADRRPDALRAEAYRLLELGRLAEAAGLAAQGQQRARTGGDAASLSAFRVLEAEVLVQDRRLPEALALLGSPLEGASPETLARAAMARAAARCLGGPGADAARVKADLQEAARLARTLGPALQAEVLLRRGSCAMIAADRAAAAPDFREVLAIARRERLPMLEAMAQASLGMVAIHDGHLDRGTQWLDQALEAFARLGAVVQALKTRANLGWGYFLLGEDQRALKILEPLVGETLASGGTRLVALSHMGNAHYRLGQLPAARGRYQELLALSRKLGHQSWEAQALESLARLALEEGDLAAAEQQATLALELFGRIADEPGRASSTLALGQVAAARGSAQRAIELLGRAVAWPKAPPDVIWEARAALARLHAGAGDRARAEVEFRNAFELMERSIGRVQAAESRLAFLSSLRRMQEEYVDFLVSGGRVQEALEAADRSRARVLREKLNAAMAPARAAELRAAAGQLGAVLLSYWVGPRRGYLWVISKDAVRLERLPGREEVKQNIQAHQRVVLSSRDPVTEGTRASRWLHDVLLKPAALPPRARVVAALDGVLHGLNLETLVVPGDPPRYWIEDATLTVVPALGLLRSGKAKAAAPRRALLIGDPLPSQGFPALPQARRELQTIAALFGPPERTVLEGAAATPEAWAKAEAGRYGFIHLAAHAEANPLSPLESAVVLSPRGDAPHKLYARDVAAARLQAELVTLSACRGAGARAYAGEGLVGLAWAFLRSGAANVVGGLWDVEDASTAQVMEELYRNVAGRKPPAEALREAKLSLLRSGTARRKPFYWGPLVMVTRGASPGAAR